MTSLPEFIKEKGGLLETGAFRIEGPRDVVELDWTKDFLTQSIKEASILTLERAQDFLLPFDYLPYGTNGDGKKWYMKEDIDKQLELIRASYQKELSSIREV